MKRRFFKRVTALLLALVTAMSLVTVSFAGQSILLIGCYFSSSQYAYIPLSPSLVAV